MAVFFCGTGYVYRLGGRAVLRAAAGNRNVVITRGADWSVVLSVGDRQVFFMDKETLSCVHVCGKDGFRLQMPLLQEESVIGFGERFNGVDQRGISLPCTSETPTFR